jgi:hypothetical protein
LSLKVEHGEHDEASLVSEYVPAGHKVQELELSKLKDPAEHFEKAVAPLLEEYFPPGQVVHV